jgi:DNA polymerase-3 subunit epsilon
MIRRLWITLSTGHLVFLDIETTGFAPPHAKITEIGALRVEDGKVVAKFNQLLNPGQPVPWQITQLTGITDEMLWDAPPFAAIADDLEVLLDGAIFVAHNVNFDYSFIKSEFELLRQGSQKVSRQTRLPLGAVPASALASVRTFDIDRFCTARLSRRLYPQQQRHNLDTIIQTHNIQVKDRHRAYDDAQVLHEFYQKALAEHGSKVFTEINRLLVRSRSNV